MSSVSFALPDTWRPNTEASLRLAGGQDNSAGRVEIFLSGEWGTVCNSGWSLEEAKVVCRELGQSHAVHVTDNRSYGPGGGHIWLSNVNCQGNEDRLIHCSKAEGSCSDHDKDVGVVCASEFGAIVTTKALTNTSAYMIMQ